MRTAASGLAIVVLLTVPACRSARDPAAAAARDPLACRNFVTASQWRATSALLSQPDVPTGDASTTDLSCQFDRRRVATRCTLVVRTGACTTTSSHTTTWRTIADMVAESKLVGRHLQQGTTSRMSIACGGAPSATGVTSTQRYVYDGQRRVVRIESQTTPAATTLTTYDAWDAQGRPTAGRLETSLSPAMTLRLSYDDVARTMQWEGTTEGQPPATTVTTFDSDGNVVSMRTVAGEAVTDARVRIDSTATVCR